MQWRDRPVILLGHGVRLAGCADLVPEIMEVGVPVLCSWQAADMMDSRHPMFFGRPGQYGQRAANKILYESDQVIALGNRLSIWNVGYEGIRADQQLIMVDCDPSELRKGAEWVNKPFPEVVRSLPKPECALWINRCNVWRERYPWLELAHMSRNNGYLSAYEFVDQLNTYLRDDEVIVTDMGTPLIAAHQLLKLKPPQRLMTSGGLGEMGCGLAAAIGASFARDGGEVLCLHADGGMMMNLQELQTIKHHHLPVKIIVFNNEGYVMIKHTQKVSAFSRSGVSAASGMSTPSFAPIADAFGIAAATIKTWDDFQEVIPAMFAAKGPFLAEFMMDPEQPLIPKLDPVKDAHGNLTSPRFDQMSPMQ